MYLTKINLKNVAPFGDLNINLKENQVLIFSSINGRGKTTLFSYIADAFFEMARVCGFIDLFEDKTKYYRVTSPSTVLYGKKYSIVYLGFQHEEHSIEYIEIIGDAREDDLKEILNGSSVNHIQDILNTIKENGSYKGIHGDKKIIKTIFLSNVLTYFPSDRFEIPWWLNETEYKRSRFNTKVKFNESLNKNIEARTVSNEVVNWILDVVLDVTASSIAHQNNLYRTDQYSNSLYLCLNNILQQVFSGKTDKCRFGIGSRLQGQARVSIVKDTGDKQIESISPSIFHLSSGEIALLVLFCEILRQYDKYPQGNIFDLNLISGIIIIDEVDKHLHIKLQKEIVPKLMSMFPKLQFIVSSHAPFFSLGASKVLEERVRYIDLTLGGKDTVLGNIDELDDLYTDLLLGNENYKKLYEEMDKESVKAKRLRIITEGNNSKYIERAIQLLNPNLSSKIHICNGVENKSGKNQLIQWYHLFLNTDAYSATLFIWDCDVKNEINNLKESEKVFKFCFEKNVSNTITDKGIENLFSNELFDAKYYISTKPIKKDFGIEIENKEFDKNLFCEDVCKLSDPKEFQLFMPLIEKIEAIITI